MNVDDLRRELKADHLVVVSKLDALDSRFHGHETRLTVLENTHRLLKWVAVTIIGGMVTWIVDMARR